LKLETLISLTGAYLSAHGWTERKDGTWSLGARGPSLHVGLALDVQVLREAEVKRQNAPGARPASRTGEESGQASQGRRRPARPVSEDAGARLDVPLREGDALAPTDWEWERAERSGFEQAW
jgi:hypothetical protein